MRSLTDTSTLKLATARLEFTDDRRLTRGLLVVAVAALVYLVYAITVDLQADERAAAATMQRLQRENVALQADLARTRTELELERSTRAALARQVAQLNQQTSDLRARVDFFSAQSSRAPRPR
jgi:hypothetical protein